MNKSEELMLLKGINKRFGTVQILFDVNLSIYKGKVHALLGSNGAGKSTLMKIIAGDYTLDSGTIHLDNQLINISSPGEAKNYGISVIHQELNLVKELTVFENIYLGKEITVGFGNFINSKKKALTMTREIINKYNIQLDPLKKVKDLSIGEQQLVEILKAVSEESKVLIMDEPTAALSVEETKQLFEVIKSLKSKGIGIIYISHRLDEIQEICDYVNILRDGRNVSEGSINNFSSERIIEDMIGTQIDDIFPSSNRKKGEELLRVEKIQNEILHNISFSLYEGEIIGIFGLIGAGQSEILNVLFGTKDKKDGDIYMKNKPVKIHSPMEAKKLGLAYVTENRKEEGLLLELGSDENMVLPSLWEFSSLGIKKQNLIKTVANNYKETLKIKLTNISQPVKNLSGGNQQKVILAKWLLTEPEIILLSEPTRGIDVGARVEIYKLLDQLANENKKGIIMASSDADEVIGVSDRIFVIFEGNIIAEINKSDATREKLMEFASGAIYVKEGV
ncbi:sugar ABC transporter ATP-binding protein [Peribacillus butanolivorans]|uniref:sugar ABC transporter ATP-binding protein n=1 Tax=Peribacillus butanolivorans TaxID=421767 RepID=UPI0037C7CC5D